MHFVHFEISFERDSFQHPARTSGFRLPESLTWITFGAAKRPKAHPLGPTDDFYGQDNAVVMILISAIPESCGLE